MNTRLDFVAGQPMLKRRCEENRRKRFPDRKAARRMRVNFSRSYAI